jgi:hypothetical protein
MIKKTAKKVEKKKATKAKVSNIEIDTTKGAVSIKAKKTDVARKNKSYSVIMRGGTPVKVEDDGEEI